MLNHLLAKSGKRAMMLVSVLMLAMATFAVPAKPGLRRLLTLTDGTTVSTTRNKIRSATSSSGIRITYLWPMVVFTLRYLFTV